MTAKTIPDHSGTHAAAIRGALLRRPDKVAFEDRGRHITYSATADMIARFMRVLEKPGPLTGVAVGVLSTNRAEAWMAAMAVSMAGGRFVGLGVRSSADDIAHMCRDCDVRILVVDPAVDDLAASVLEQLEDLPTVHSFGRSDLGPDLLAAADEVGAAALTVSSDVTASTISKILYTGGSTGRPKGVIYSQAVDLSNSTLPLSAYGLPWGVRSLVCAPMTHAGNPVVGSTLISGGTVVVHPAFAPDTFVDAVQNNGVTSTIGVPTMLYAIQDYVEGRQVDLSGLRHFLYAASPISPTRLAAAQERFGQVFVQAYSGMELAGLGSILHADEHDLSRPEQLASCGRPMPGVQMVVVDAEGNPLPPGEPGEVWVRGHGLFVGYVNMPDETRAAMEGGFFHTGDVAVMDENGYFTIVDRMKDVIMSGGFSVFSREVEDAITSDPRVRMAAVIGVPDNHWGEAVTAIVVPADGNVLSAEDVISRVRSSKGAVSAPKRVEFVTELPLTPVGKIDKRKLRSGYWNTEDGREVH